MNKFFKVISSYIIVGLCALFAIIFFVCAACGASDMYRRFTGEWLSLSVEISKLQSEKHNLVKANKKITKILIKDNNRMLKVIYKDLKPAE